MMKEKKEKELNNKITMSLIACVALNTYLAASETIGNVEVISNPIITTELEATYATELYTKEDIEKSNATTIYDFLSTQTSVNIAPSYGNQFSQLIDLGGYGLTSGYKNVVITVDGKRLNNIDGIPQLLSSISLSSIEKIEIIKGSGSVAYGDGATGGVINIVTNGKNSNYIKTTYGSNGTKTATLSLGYNTDDFVINGFIDNASTNGTRLDKNGKIDENNSKNKSLNLLYFPSDSLELRIGRTFSSTHSIFGGDLNEDAYHSTMITTKTWSDLTVDAYTTNAGLTYDINKDYSLDVNYFHDTKSSGYAGYSANEYTSNTLNSKFNIKKDKYSLVLGVDSFDGERKGSSDITSKKNQSLFLDLNYKFSKDLKTSLGVRKEQVTYNYSPTSGTDLESKENLYAFDLGINYKVNDNSSIFANYNKSFQTPDIDMFFASNYPSPGYSFNGFIEPSKVKTLRLGYSNIQINNKLKVSIFRSNLKNEIYYYTTGSKNTNIDKSHKYGINVFDKYIISKNLHASFNYSYLIAKIDEENEASGAYNGKYLPGVSKHNLTLNVGYNYDALSAVLSQTYRSSAYSAEDFANNFSQKQDAYSVTDLSLTYTYNKIEFFAKVNNIFDEKNGFWIRDNAIYPINFERLYTAGLRYDF